MTDLIALIIRETGWTLEYVLEQPVSTIRALAEEINYQKAEESYQAASNAAMIVCALINSKDRHYQVEEIIGHPPERRDMADLEQKDITVDVDGKTYTLRPLTMNMAVELQKKFGKEAWAEIGKGSPDFELLRMAYYLRAQRSHPEITLEQAGEIALSEIGTIGL